MSRRQKIRRQRTTAFWADKDAAAGDDPAAQAQVAWDRLRASIRELPQDQQARAFKYARAQLRQMLHRLPIAH
jgi:hypothetical protein